MMTKGSGEKDPLLPAASSNAAARTRLRADHYGPGRIHSASGDATETILRIRAAQRTIAKRTRTAIS
jgi:hypothetical protein